MVSVCFIDSFHVGLAYSQISVGFTGRTKLGNSFSIAIPNVVVDTRILEAIGEKHKPWIPNPRVDVSWSWFGVGEIFGVLRREVRAIPTVLHTVTAPR